MARYRRKMGRRESRKQFTKYAKRTHRKNVLPRTLQRGGNRM